MIGERIGNFRLTALLGVGGMGEVFLAEHEQIGTKAAIKLLQPHISANKANVDRFFGEAIAASRVKHSGITKISDVGFSQSGRAYLIMELLEGESLAARIRRLGRLPIDHAAEIGRQIASVLDAVHKAGITHRDLKPDNVFLTPDAELASGERVKLLDFGIAKLSGTGGMTATSAGAMGTPAYMSPEQWHNAKNVDWRTDSYSLGCLLFEMLVGHPPFVAESIGEACSKHLAVPPPRLAQTMPGAPATLDALIDRLLVKSPEQRTVTMREIGGALGGPSASASLPIPAVSQAFAPVAPTIASAPLPTTLGGAAGSAPVATRRRNPLLVPLIAGGVVLAGIVVVLAVMLSRPPEEAAQVAQQPIARPEVASEPPPKAERDVEVTDERPVEPPIEAQRPEPKTVAPPVEEKRPEPKTVTPPVDEQRPEPKTVTPPPRREPPKPGGCDEVSCLLSNYEGACCSKFKKGKRPPSEKPSSDLPSTLDRAMISSAMAQVKARVVACGDRSSSSGTVKVSVKVSANGSIAAVTVKQAPDPNLGACVASAVRTARFPRTQDGGSFTYPFVL